MDGGAPFCLRKGDWVACPLLPLPFSTLSTSSLQEVLQKHSKFPSSLGI